MVTAKAGLMEARMGHQKVQYLDPDLAALIPHLLGPEMDKEKA